MTAGPTAPGVDPPGGPDLAAGEFWTLLGPDFAGKSTVLNRLHDEHGWRVVSYDNRYLESYPLVRRLRELWIDGAFVWAGKRYTAELVLSVLHAIVLHLRDETVRAVATGEPVIVDSYYYKLLAKCRLHGVGHDPTFDYWRSFPQPRGVLYIDVPGEEAWLRSGRGTRTNPFEHHGPAAERESFVRFQDELREAILAEVGEVPVTFVDGCAPPDEVAAKVLAALEMTVAR